MHAALKPCINRTNDNKVNSNDNNKNRCNDNKIDTNNNNKNNNIMQVVTIYMTA